MGRAAIIIDGDNVAKRAIMATAKSDLEAGVWNGGIYNALSLIAKSLAFPDYRPGAVFAVFDDGIPAFRLDLCPTYKKDRKDKKSILTPDQKREAYRQVGQLREILEAMGVVCVSFPRHEADDVIAALARRLRDQRTIVMSNDKDLWQLMERELGRVAILDPGSGKLRHADDMFEAIGVEPELYLVYKVLVGDSSDGVPGAVGVGTGRAAELVQAASEVLKAEIRPDRLNRFIKLVEESYEDMPVDKRPKYVTGIIDGAKELLKAQDVVDISDTFSERRYGKALDALVKKRTYFDDVKVLRLCTKYKIGAGTEAVSRMSRLMKQVVAH